MDPEFAALLAILPRFDLTDVAKLRAVIEQARPRRPMAAHPDVAIRHETIPGRHGGPAVDIRLYSPSERSGPVPGVVWCHGGGFIMGSPDSDHARCLRYAAGAGVVVVSPDYRLAPEHRFPAGLDDCSAALDWLVAEAEALGVDPARVAVGGTSAGAALAAGMALRERDRGGAAPALLVLVCPVTDNRLTSASIRQFRDLPGWNGTASELMWRHYLPTDGAVFTYAAPNRAQSLRGLPPTHITIAELDPLRDEGLGFAERLRQDGVPTTVRLYADVPHGFDSLLPSSDISTRSVDAQIRALNDHLGHDRSASAPPATVAR